MRVLILSRSPWNKNNSFGNTFSNLFGKIDDIEIANIYCASGHPEESVAVAHFQITEKRLVQNLICSSTPTGMIVTQHKQSGTSDKKKNQISEFAKKLHWQIFYWTRDLVWALGRWKSKELMQFVEEFNADLIYAPIYNSKYMCAMNSKLHEELGIPMVGHVSDDVYAVNCYRLSPLFWIDCLFTKRKIRELIKKCVYVDTFTEIQKIEYEKIFKIPFHVIHKNADFSGEIPDYISNNQPLRLIFTGNIGSGRWKTLALIGQALAKINEAGTKAQLHLYTATPMSAKMKKALTIPDSILLCGQVPASEIPAIQQSGDILLHVESFGLKGKLEVRMSFSTKIVDYMMRGRAIFAVGPHDVASVDFLKSQDCAITVTNQVEIEDKLSEIIAHPELLEAYRQKAWDCGKREFDAVDEKKKFEENLKKACLASKQIAKRILSC